MSDKDNHHTNSMEQEVVQHILPSAKTTCWTPGFVALLITQFTVAMNDNVFRWLIIPIGKHLMDADTVRTLGAVFLLLPFLVFASVAGFITDRYSRRKVMIWCKFVEMVLLAFSVIVICFMPGIDGTVKVGILLVILFLLGTQSAFFSPSKYGVIPDLVPENQISNANGLIAMTTMIAIVGGQIVGGYLFAWTTIFGETRDTVIGDPGGANWMITFGVLVGIALIGYIASFFVPKLDPTNPTVRFEKNIFKQTGIDLKMLFSYRALFWVAIASSFFWGLGAISQTNIDKYASDFLKVPQEHVTVLAAILSLGIGAGAVLAGWLSKGRIELGMAPIGLLGMGVFAILLGFTPALGETVAQGEGTVNSTSYIYGSLGLMMLGLMAGLYDVPLAAYLQHKSPKEKRGRILAAYNFCSFGFMLVFSGLFFGFAKIFAFTGSMASLWIWISVGVVIMVVLLFLTKNLFLELTAFLLRTMFRLLYRVEVRGEENVPLEGGVLLTANHVSYLDGLLLYVFCPRPIRFFAHNAYIKGWVANHLAKLTRIMRIVPGKKSVIDAIKQARKGLTNGDAIGIFPEGGITRTGQIKEFEPGYTAFLKGNENVPIVPVYIGGLFGSVFSYADRKRSFFSWPRALRYKVVLEFGKPVPADTPTHVLKHKIDEMASDAVVRCNGKNFVPIRQMLRKFKSLVWSNRIILADSTNVEINARTALMRILVARRLFHREVFQTDQKFVAILAPPSVGGVIVNAAVALDRRTIVNLNYTFSSDLLNYCLEQTEVRQVLTSKKVLEKLDFKLNAKMICIEDLVKKVRLSDKLLAVLYTFVLPAWLVERLIGAHKAKADDICTVVYTSGSTGLPKGAMLCNRGISENIDGARTIMNLKDTHDSLLAMLPLFHAFGFTVGVWIPCLLGLKSVYHYSPLDPRTIGKLSNKHKTTFMAATATFLRSYIRKCPREDFESLGALILGAEKMPKDIADAWEEKYGVRPREGYGTTELSPFVCVNVPAYKHHDDFQLDYREGSIGRAFPGQTSKIVNPETWEELPVDTPGMLVIKGANVMTGYYKQPELTAKSLHDGWSITGDIARIDKDGFIFITGRESRISKIGGEMVPHIMIEEQLLDIFKRHVVAETQEVDDTKSDEEKTSIPLVVASVPDQKKGERIVVLYTKLPISAEEMCKEMRTTGCPLIWVPSPQSFYEVEFIPSLGTGKLDLSAVKKMVTQICNP